MAARQNSGCSQVMVATLGVIGVILTGVFAIGAAVLGREDVPLPFLNRPAVEQPANPANTPPDSSSGTTNTIDTSGSTGGARYQTYLQGYIVDGSTSASAAYELDVTAEQVGGENRSVFVGNSITSLYDTAGALYTRKSEVKGEFNNGVLSFSDANVTYEDALPSGLSWCVLSAMAYADNPQGSSFTGSYSSANPPCSGTISVQVMSQNPLP